MTRRHSRALRAFNAAQRRLDEHILTLVLQGQVQALSANQTQRFRELLTPVLRPELEETP